MNFNPVSDGPTHQVFWVGFLELLGELVDHAIHGEPGIHYLRSSVGWKVDKNLMGLGERLHLFFEGSAGDQQVRIYELKDLVWLVAEQLSWLSERQVDRFCGVTLQPAGEWPGGWVVLVFVSDRREGLGDD
jgi:hypothetical protein